MLLIVGVLWTMLWEKRRSSRPLGSACSLFVRSQSDVIVGGVFTGPLFGWLGNRWRNDRAWLGAIAIAAAFCLEPVARIPAGQAIDFRAVWIAEVAAGLAMVLYVATEALAAQTRARRDAT
jgi:hypothetical protein